MTTRLLLELIIAPALAAAATLAGRRWRPGVGGLVSAFPAIAGPLLVISAHAHGAAFAAHAANGILLGLTSLSAFVVAYARACRRRGWLPSAAAGWFAAGVFALIAAALEPGPPAGLAAAVLSLSAAARLLPATGGTTVRVSPPDALGSRMLSTALLVVVLAAAADRLGALVGGLLAGLPVLACVLAVHTQREGGAGPTIELLRGMTRGMAGFVAFCAVVQVLVVPAGPPVAFAAATVCAVALQLASARAMRARGRAIPLA